MRLIRQEGLSEVAGGLVNRWFSPVFTGQQPKLVEQFTNDLRLFSPDEYLAGCEAIRDADFCERVQQIKSRTLIIAGSEDRAVTLADAEYLSQRIRGSQLLVLPCGHLACVESPEAFSRSVIEFLTRSTSH